MMLSYKNSHHHAACKRVVSVPQSVLVNTAIVILLAPPSQRSLAQLMLRAVALMTPQGSALVCPQVHDVLHVAYSSCSTPCHNVTFLHALPGFTHASYILHPPCFRVQELQDLHSSAEVQDLGVRVAISEADITDISAELDGPPGR